MKNWFLKIDFTLTFRLILSVAMLYTGYYENDNMALIFGVFLAVYSIIANKYKLGCGYNGCGYAPKYEIKKDISKTEEKIDFTEFK